MLGTVGRWVEVLTEWNPGLSDASALRVVEAFFGELRLPLTRRRDFLRVVGLSDSVLCAGLKLPGVENRLDLESALT